MFLPSALIAAFAMATLTACGGNTTEEGSSTDPVVVKVTIADGTITTAPTGNVDVAIGQDVSLEITSDVDDEIHVHSSPAQEREFSVGSTTLDLGSFSVPGQIDIEVHNMEAKLTTLVVE